MSEIDSGGGFNYWDKGTGKRGRGKQSACRREVFSDTTMEGRQEIRASYGYGD